MENPLHTPPRDDPKQRFPLERRPPLLNIEQRQLTFEISPPVSSSPHTSPPSSAFHTAAATSGSGSSGAETGYHTPWEVETKPSKNPRGQRDDFPAFITKRGAPRGAANSRLMEPASTGYEAEDEYGLEFVTKRRTTEVLAPTYAHSALRDYAELKASFRHDPRPNAEGPEVELEQHTDHGTDDEPSSLTLFKAVSRNSSELCPEYGWGTSGHHSSAAISTQKEERRNASSPSALSQSSIISGMEWDPYADVGHSTAHHPTPSGALSSYRKSKPLDSVEDKRPLPAANAENRKDEQAVPHEAGREHKAQQPVFSSIGTTFPPAVRHGHSADSSSNGSRNVGTGTVSSEIFSSPPTQRQAQSEVGNHPVVQLVNKSMQTDQRLDKTQSGQDGRSHSHHSRHTHSGSKLPSVPSRHHRRLHDETTEREHGESEPELTSSSGLLTPTCSFINAVVRSGAPMDGKLNQAIDAHRHEHIVNVRRELRRVMKLSEILCGGMNNRPSSSALCTSDSHNSDNSSHPVGTRSSSDTLKRLMKTAKESKSVPEIPRPKRRPVNTPNTSGSTVQDQKVDELISTFHKLLQANRPTSNTASSAADRTQTCKTVAENLQENIRSRRPSSVAREKKVDELSKAFRTILDCMVAGGGGPSEQTSPGSLPTTTATSSHRRHTRQKNACGKAKPPCVPVKPPVSYFLPLPSPFDPVWIRPAPPTIDDSDVASSDKENDQEYEQEERELRERLAKLSLHDICSQTHAEFMKRAKARASLLASVREVRKKRADLTRKWIGSHGTENLSRLEPQLPPKGQRVVSSQEIRKLGQKYYNLPEVVEKKLKSKKEKEKETNRLMSKYFSGRLQGQVLKGRVNVELNKSIIRK